ncbi:MAG: hypothetical protein ABIG46_02945 [Candidatus Omnitrophota bacterium]
MDEKLQEKFFFVLIIVCLLLLIAGVNSCSRLHQQKSLKNDEMSKRLDAEEALALANKEMSILGKKISAKEDELAKARQGVQLTEELLKQVRQESQGLREELVKINKVKEALEEQLKEFLTVTAVAPKSKKR